MNKQDYLKELSLFADIDSIPKALSDGAFYVIKFTQNGVPVEIKVAKDGSSATEIRPGGRRSHSSYRSLLASENFGNIKRLADAQRAFIKVEAPYIEDVSSQLPIVGSFSDGDDGCEDGEFIGKVRELLSAPLHGGMGFGKVRALVVDGPAGIGKTHLIRYLAFERAGAFGPGAAPPILHVQSRGRKLTTLNDVLAGTLQTLRSSLTFDQVPVMVRHELLQVAIDGFDELADPQGYETAWGSLRDFVEDLNGQGTIILAGRDTFINAKSIRRSVALLDSEMTVAVHLRSLQPQEARAWLGAKKWAASRIEKLEELGLFEDGSYALRPFFLSKISDVAKDGKSFNEFAQAPLNSLVDAMLQREAKLAARKITGVDFVEVYRELLMEVARDMADSEVDSVDVSTLHLIAEMVFSKYLSGDDLAVSINRVSSISLLEGDARSGTRAFPHTEIMSYFLSRAYLALVVSGDYPKSIRRGIVGRDFLGTFSEVLRAEEKNSVRDFCVSSQECLERRLLDGRGGRNVCSLLFAALDADVIETEFRVSAQQVDEVVIKGVLPKGTISAVEFSALDVRGGDLSRAIFSNCAISQLVADSTTRLPPGFPRPSQIMFDSGGVVQELAQDSIPRWIEERTVSLVDEATGGAHWLLFERICRAMIRQFWIRSAGDDPAARLLAKDEWYGIKRVLDDEGVLKVRTNVAAGGPKSEFYRLENARDYLSSSHQGVVNNVVRRIRQLDE
ncbi:hypothetical protein [Stenotrophomonas acidaminiphila]